jgi:hypothetical protein
MKQRRRLTVNRVQGSFQHFPRKRRPRPGRQSEPICSSCPLRAPPLSVPSRGPGISFPPNAIPSPYDPGISHTTPAPSLSPNHGPGSYLAIPITSSLPLNYAIPCPGPSTVLSPEVETSSWPFGEKLMVLGKPVSFLKALRTYFAFISQTCVELVHQGNDWRRGLHKCILPLHWWRDIFRRG